MTEASAGATDQAPLAWLAMEADDTDQDGAEVSLIVWPSGVKFDVWRADFHSRWVRWVPPIWPPRLGPRQSARHSPWDVFGNDQALTSLKKPVHPLCHKFDQSRPDNRTNGAPFKCLEKRPQ